MVDLWNLSGPLMLKGLGISNRGLVQQLLKNTTVVEAKPYLWDQSIWDVNGKAAPFDADVKDMTGVLPARAAGFAGLAPAGGSPQAPRPQNSGPQASGFFFGPMLDIGGRLCFSAGRLC